VVVDSALRSTAQKIFADDDEGKVRDFIRQVNFGPGQLFRTFRDAHVPIQGPDRPRTSEFQFFERFGWPFQTMKRFPLSARSYGGLINNSSGCPEACEKISAKVLRRIWMVFVEDAEDEDEE
jgi:hypothetical protein